MGVTMTVRVWEFLQDQPALEIWGERASSRRTPSLFYLGSMSAWMTGVKNVPDQRTQVINNVQNALAVWEIQ